MMNFLQEKRSKVKEETYNCYRLDLEHFQKFMNSEEIHNATEGVASYLRFLEGTDSEATKKRRIATLKVYFKFLDSRGLTQGFVFPKVATSPFKKKPRMKIKEIEKLMSYIDGLGNKVEEKKSILRDKAFFELVIVFGLKASVISSLSVEDVDLENRIISCEGSEYPLLHNESLRIIRRYIEIREQFDPQTNYLFLNNSGGLWKADRIALEFKKYLKKAELNASYTLLDLVEGVRKEYILKGLNYRSYQLFKQKKWLS